MLPPPNALMVGNPLVASVGTTPVVVLPTVRDPAPGDPATSSRVDHWAATVVADVVFTMGTRCRAAATSPSTVVIAISGEGDVEVAGRPREGVAGQ